MVTSGIQATSTDPPATPPVAKAAAKDDHGFSFHDLLSAMNPLQYLPVVGTLYRAMTGDVIPEGLRRVGSLVVSGLLGGPIGLVGSIAATIAEKITGIDPEAVVARVVQHDIPAPASAAISTVPTPSAEISTVPTAPAAPVHAAMTLQQLAAYGVRSDAAGTLKLGDVEGADVLNSIQLVRIKEASAAYVAIQSG